MAYATIDEVERLMAQFSLSGSSKPDITEAEAMLAAIDAEVDVALASAGVAVPVTMPAYFVTWLSEVTAWGAAAGILKSMFPRATGEGEASQSVHAFWEKRYQNAIASIRSREAIPPDVPTNAANVAPSTYLTRNPDSEEDLGVIAEPRFTMSKVF